MQSKQVYPLYNEKMCTKTKFKLLPITAIVFKTTDFSGIYDSNLSPGRNICNFSGSTWFWPSREHSQSGYQRNWQAGKQEQLDWQ